MNIQPGTFVRHSTQPAWGTGKVIELVGPDKARIRFAGAGEKLMLLSAAPLETVTPSDAEEKALTERRARARKVGEAKSHDELVAAFLRKYPQGFEDPGYFKDERDDKVKAHELAASELAKERLAGADPDAVADAALKVLQATNLVFPNERIVFRKALAEPSARRDFAPRFVDLLHGTAPFQERFEVFADFLAESDAPKWTLATYYPYFVYPSEHMFLKPQVTQRAADAYSFALEYEAQPNWKTYERLQAFVRMLQERLAPLGPRDMFDVQSFIWVAGGA